VTELDVSKLLSLSPRKSCLLAPIPACLLYKCKSAFIPAITKIINAALSEGMPLEFKVSSVTPILKKRGLDTEVFSSYRPVSNLPFLSKLIERAASSQITRYLSNNNLWDPHQSAYRVSHSCETALLYVFNGILKGMDDRKVTLLVLLDLSSAFDCGDVHKWIMSYLDDRKQFVSCGGVSSSTCSVTCGVPQGSVLGPLLFNLYLTGLRDVILPFSVDYMVYADDLQLSATTTLSDIYSTITRLEECITAIQSWFSFSLLTLNVLKTEFIILGSPSLISKCPIRHITVGGEQITVSSTVRNLGIHVDSSLSMHSHILTTCAKSFAALRSVARIKKSLTVHHRHLLIHSLVLSNLEFCSSLYFNLPCVWLQKLQTVINTSLRFVKNLKRRTHTSQLLKDHGWLTMQGRIELRLSIIVYNVLKTGQPSYLYKLLSMNLPSRNLRSAQMNLLLCPRIRSEIGSRVFYHSGPTIWNM
jgi:hypothetical protein